MMYELDGMRPNVDESVYLAPGTYLIGDITLKEDVSIWFNAVLRAENDSITIESGSNVQEGTTIHVDEGFPVHIGKNVTIGHNCIIHGCTIEEGALIGMGAIILNGAHIKKGAVVAAGAVVGENKVIEEGMLAAGVPAKPLKQINDRLKQRILEGANHYQRNGRRFRDAGIVAKE
ncbi:gamma carbonic anhydrase family protein [Mesobacillus maritimus]|jgi:carbonic anhydrase/acetyltransferase-like protein (isoleucine patch superfamily)|uniref:Gamma carbonic anhydrase family protein n=1 Tax=Mesobacillus maritimus TaxID=1643336 RepID=A0ABS7K0B1_9BACI|nr:gamma carbonic anhydrase family protein [Mesobacillus maritimus]MBY0095610.1 gamma carbonic anhydrase family protein [Mesobacillus maritimus]